MPENSTTDDGVLLHRQNLGLIAWCKLALKQTRSRLLSWIILLGPIGSVATLLLPWSENKVWPFFLFQTIVVFAIMLSIAFIRAPQKSTRFRRGSKALQQFWNWWSMLWASWFLLYAFLTVVSLGQELEGPPRELNSPMESPDPSVDGALLNQPVSHDNPLDELPPARPIIDTDRTDLSAARLVPVEGEETVVEPFDENSLLIQGLHGLEGARSDPHAQDDSVVVAGAGQTEGEAERELDAKDGQVEEVRENRVHRGVQALANLLNSASSLVLLMLYVVLSRSTLPDEPSQGSRISLGWWSSENARKKPPKEASGVTALVTGESDRVSSSPESDRPDPSDESSARFAFLRVEWAKMAFFASMLLGIFLLEALLPLRETDLQFIDVVHGLIGATAMALFVGKLDSRLLGIPVLVVAMLFFYAGLQPSYGIVTAYGLESHELRVIVIMLALFLKVLLFATVHWLLYTDRMLYYLVGAQAMLVGISEDRTHFMKKLAQLPMSRTESN